jgi:hypothetical protein
MVDLAHASAEEQDATGEHKLAEGIAAAAAGRDATTSAAERAKHHWHSAEAFTAAIAAFSAGLVHDDDISDELSAKLEASRDAAKLEVTRANARKELAEGHVKMEEGAAANKTEDYTLACEKLTEAQLVFGGLSESFTENDEIVTACAAALASAVLELARYSL